MLINIEIQVKRLQRKIVKQTIGRYYVKINQSTKERKTFTI